MKRRTWIFDLQLFAEGDGGTGTGAGGQGTGAGTGAQGGTQGGAQGGQGAGAAAGDGGTGDGTGDAGDKGKKVEMTQEELDRLITDRLKRQEKKLKDQWAAEQVEAQRQAQMTDLEKEKAARQKAEDAAKATQEKANQALKRAAILVEAGKAGAIDPDDVFRLASLDNVDVDDQGNVTGADKAVQELAKAKPHLFKAAGGGTPGAPFRGDQGSNDPAEYGRKIAEERNKAKQAPVGGFDPWATK